MIIHAPLYGRIVTMHNSIIDVQNFHDKFGLDELRNKKPDFIKDRKLALTRVNFMLEELKEYAHATGFYWSEAFGRFMDPDKKVKYNYDLEGALDALLDLIWVAIGTADFHGFCNINDKGYPMSDGWVRVYTANMMKKRVKDAKESKRNDPYDLIKPEGWKPPEFKDLLLFEKNK